MTPGDLHDDLAHPRESVVVAVSGGPHQSRARRLLLVQEVLPPQQGVVATIVSAADDYATQVQAKFAQAGLRFDLDTRNEKINFKVREHSLGKVPLIAVVGEREAANGTIALRRLGSQGQEILPVEEAIAALRAEARPPDLR